MALLTVPETVFTTLVIVSMAIILVITGVGLVVEGCNSGGCYEPGVPTKRVMKLSCAFLNYDVFINSRLRLTYPKRRQETNN